MIGFSERRSAFRSLPRKILRYDSVEFRAVFVGEIVSKLARFSLLAVVVGALIALGLLLYSHFAYRNAWRPEGGKPDPDGKKSYEQFRATIKLFPYSTSSERQLRIVKNYPSLRVGMDKQQVAALIGDPDYSELDWGPKGAHPHWRGSDWAYWLSMRSDESNLSDPRVEIFFGLDGHLTWAVPQGIGLPEIGNCCSNPKP